MIRQGKKAIACWRMWMCVYNNRCAVAREAATAPFHLKSDEKVIHDDSIFLEIPNFFFFFPVITTREKKIQTNQRFHHILFHSFLREGKLTATLK